MKVIIVGSFAASLVNFRGALIKALHSRGHQVHACAPGLSEDEATSVWLNAQGVECHDVPLSRVGLNPMHDISALVVLVRLMLRIRPDVFLGYTIKPVIWGILAARIALVPKRVALITGVGYAFTGEASGLRWVVKRVARFLYALAIKSSDLVFFQNPDDRADFKRLGILAEDTSVELVNGSGVDTAHFGIAPLPEGPMRFLLIARLLGDKGIREYVAAARQLSERWPGVEFHLVGGVDPSPNAISREEAESFTDNANISWHGPLDDVRTAIAACHVYVLPSYREGTPRTVLEAMSMGRAVVTTDAPGCRETVVDGQNGFLVEPRDVGSLAEAMERFLTDPSIVPIMGAASRRVAEEKYDVDKVNASIMAAIGL